MAGIESDRIESRRKTIARRRRSALLAGSAALLLMTLLGGCQKNEDRSPAYRIAQDVYYDKTLAGILGQVGGVLTGYEFVSEDPLPDEWFGFIKGPYSGNSEFVTQAENDRIFEDRGGAIGSDDDYHVDFFNQLILDEHGPDATNEDIRQEWLDHDVSDWGGGGTANELIKTMNMSPPQTGKSEFNKFYWVTESYIENDTLGMNAPGMPVTASRLTEKFASLSGEFDTVVWAKLLGTMYSLAYVEDDARVVLDKAADVLPRDSWPYRMYLKAKALHDENPDDWRWAQARLREAKRLVYGWDNIQVIPDINNALAMLAILYGENDYTQSARIASLSGYDADCTASFVMGLMGIIKGMDGTPKEVKDAIYQDGKGVYVNDMDFTPHINTDYPAEQKFTDIAKLYQKNAERMIAARGGKIANGEYVIRGEVLRPKAIVAIPNGDFEQGTLTGWTAWKADGTKCEIHAQDNESALSGTWNGRIDLDQGGEGRLFATLNGLKKGQLYRVQAYLTADDGAEARLYAEQSQGAGDAYSYASVTNRTGLYASRTLEFAASGKSAKVGLQLLSDNRSTSMSAAIDNLTVEPIEVPDAAVYEAESATERSGEATTADAEGASGGKFVALAGGPGALTFANVDADKAGEYAMRIYYANGWHDADRLDIEANGKATGSVWLPQTGGDGGAFSRNQAEITVLLKKGANRLKLGKQDEAYGDIGVDRIEIRPRYDDGNDNND